uniref:Fibronectin type-III domain-containing protein n=1 Tax=Macrostomum lignano TaxID=282301 RepID=A0A1I8IBA7_9PLAT
PNIWPNGSHVLQAGSDVTFQCSGQAAANRRCSNLTLLYSPRGSDWQSASTTELLMINHSCRNHSLASFLLSNVSTFGGYTGWYWCGCTFTAADSANVSTSRLDKQGDCDNYNDRTGVCDWGLELAQSSVYIFKYRVNVTLTLCNQLQWCSTQLYEFDLRDKEKPSPVKKLTLHFEPQQLNISWTAPSSPLPGNQEYSYQVLLSDGRSLATNSTAVSVAVSPDTEYSVTVRCRPRHFSGHWSDNSSGSGRSGEWLPCNPELDEAFLLPPNQLLFPASDRRCRNGRVLLYRVANLGTNQSETLAVSDKFSTTSYLSIVLNSSMLSLEFESTLAIFASTSYGENSSLPNRLIHLPPLTAACSGGSDSQKFVICLINSTNFIADCNRSGHVTKPVTSSVANHQNRGFAKNTWQIRRGVACPVLPVSASATTEGSSGFSSWYPVLLAVSVLIVVGVGVAMVVRRLKMRRQAQAVPKSDPQKYISEPDATPVSASSRVVAMHIGGAGLTAATLLTGLMVAAAAQLPAVFVLEQSPADKVLLKGSNVTFFCHYQKQQQAFVNSTPLDQVRLLFNQDPSDSTKMTFLPQLWRNSSVAAFHFANVSVSRHSGWYRCGCRDSGGRPLVMSEATQLTVGFPTAVDFFWQDRRYATLVVRPSLPAIANSTGVPPSLGGRLTLAVGVLQLKLALHFEPQQLNISWTAPSSPLPGNQEYSYQVLLSDGRSLATNSTAVSVAVSPDTEYSVTVRCRPRHFSGHWSDNSSGSGRSGEWLPCNPELDEAFLLPPNQLVFPASDRSCRNGRVLLYRVANLGTNQSETLAVSKKFSTASYLSIVLNSSMLSLKFESTLAIFASTSYGENSSLPNRSIHLPPLTAACSGGSDSQTFVSCLVNSTNLIADCNRSGHVTGNRGFSKETWQIRGSVACPVLPVSAFATAEGSSGFSSWYLVLLVVGSILIVSAIGVAMAVRRWTMRRRAEAVPLSDPQKYISEPDATLVSAGLPYDTAQSLLHQEDPSSAGSIEAPEGYVSR